jgi:6-phosphogluconolactonase (cycloisomerase 2 family)
MTIKLRLLLCAMAVLATMSMVDCNEYSCGGFGSLPCTAGGGSGSGSFGGGGGGGNTTDAVYAYATDTSGVTMDGYGLNSTAGTFSTISGYTAPALPDAEPGVGMVIAQNQFLYTAFETEGAIYGWSISSSGALTALTPVSVALDIPILAAFNQYNLATNPAGTLLFVSDTALGEIIVFQIGSTGTLTPVGSPITTPIEPGNLATDGQGNYLYVTQSLGTGGHVGGTQLLAYAIGTGANLGVLTAVAGSPFTLPVPMWQVQGEPSGNFLIGTSGNNLDFTGQDDLHLYVFSIAPTTATAPGAIAQVTNSPFTTTYSPFSIAVQPTSTDGEFVYSFSINDTDTGYNPVEGFQLNTTTGALTELSNSPFSQVATGHWGQFDQSGAYLFAYSSSLVGGITGAQLGVLNVSSTGALTQPISSMALATPGYWAVTDPQ